MDLCDIGLVTKFGDPCPDAAKADNGNPLSFDEGQPLDFVFVPLSQHREHVRPFNLVVVIALECAKPSVDYLHVRFQCIPSAQVVSFILLYGDSASILDARFPGHSGEVGASNEARFHHI